jgi:integrase
MVRFRGLYVTERRADGLPWYQRGTNPPPRLASAQLAGGAGEYSHRFHDLRHTFGTAMAAAGVPMRTLQEWMGHRDIATTERYADYSPHKREAEMVAAAFAREAHSATARTALSA